MATLNPARSNVSIWSGQRGISHLLSAWHALYILNSYSKIHNVFQLQSGMLGYPFALFKPLCASVGFVVVAWLNASLTNQAVLKWGQYSVGLITKAADVKWLQNPVQTVTNMPALTHMQLAALGCTTVGYVGEHILPTIVRSPVLGGECVSPGALWQAEAESSAVLSRTVQDKGPLPPVWG